MSKRDSDQMEHIQREPTRSGEGTELTVGLFRVGRLYGCFRMLIGRHLDLVYVAQVVKGPCIRLHETILAITPALSRDHSEGI